MTTLNSDIGEVFLFFTLEQDGQEPKDQPSSRTLMSFLPSAHCPLAPHHFLRDNSRAETDRSIMAADASSEHRRRALVVDNEPSIRVLLTEVLQREGFEVVGAADGSEATSHAHKQNFDLITMDLYMDSVDGITSIEAIRELGKKTPIIVITGSASPENRKAAIAAGAARIMPKPLALADFRQVVKDVLASNSANEQDLPR